MPGEDITPEQQAIQDKREALRKIEQRQTQKRVDEPAEPGLMFDPDVGKFVSRPRHTPFPLAPRRPMSLVLSMLFATLVAVGALVVFVFVSTGGAGSHTGSHRGYAWSVAFSPDGRILASGSDDRTVRLWDVKTHRQLAILRGHTGPVDGVAFSPNGRTLASTSLDDRTIRLWNISTHEQAGKPLRPAQGAFRIAFSPDGRTLASAGWDHTVRLWNVRTHKLAGVLRGQTDEIYSVAFSPDGQTLAADSLNGPVRLWNVASRRQLGHRLGGVATLKIGQSGVAFSPDGRILASAAPFGNGAVRLWDAHRHKLLGVLYLGCSCPVHDVAFSPNGRILASADGAGGQAVVQLWVVRTQTQVGSLVGHTEDDFESISFSPDGRLIATAGGFGASLEGSTGTIVLWDAHTRRQIGQPLDG